MSDHESRIDVLESELARVKAQYARTRFILPLAVLIAAVPFLVAGSGQQVVKAERFEVTKGDKIVAVLTSDDDGGVVEVYNKDGGLVGEFLTNTDGAGMLNLYDKAENLNASLQAGGASPHGALSLYNGDEKRVVWLTTTEDDHGSISVYTKDNKEVAWLSASEAGQGFGYFYNNAEKRTAAIGASSEGTGFSQFTNASGTQVVWVGGNTGGGGQIDVYNSSGTMVGWLAADRLGYGQLSVRHTDGTEGGIMTCNSDGGHMTLRTPSGTVRWSAP